MSNFLGHLFLYLLLAAGIFGAMELTSYILEDQYLEQGR